MNREQFNKFIRRPGFTGRPLVRRDWSRRQFFEVLGAGVTASFVPGRAAAAQPAWQASVKTMNTARNVIFILLTGAPSHVDTFDLKVLSGTTPDAMKAATVKGVAWPSGVFPKLGQGFDDLAIVRSVRSWALVHSLCQVWSQIGRNPGGVLGDVAPNFGSIVANEKAAERQASQVFPAFISLNSGGFTVGSGFLDSRYAPYKIVPATAGLTNVSNADGETRFNAKWNLMHQLDDPLRLNSPSGREFSDMDQFYLAAKGLTYNATVNKAFSYASADSTRYGATGFGNACLLAKQILAANQGTRFIEITLGGWDMHNTIYGVNNDPTKGPNIYTLGKQLDDGMSALIADLKSAGMFNETLIVVTGEFGRTVGKVNATGGRDHFAQQSVVFAGAGVKGGRAIGSTNADGSATVEPGWSRNRDVRPEDIEATIYSALGINWTTVRYDDPFGRGFEYVPHAKEDVYGPINELWS